MKQTTRKIHQIDAKDRAVGRVAAEIVTILRGKNKVTFRPHLDEGDTVEVINCDQLKFTGKKLEQREYIWHTMHPGGLKRKKVADVFAQNPGEVLRRAVLGMLPDNKLRKKMIKRLLIKKVNG